MTKIQNLFLVLVIEYCNLRFVCNLVLGAWDFINSITPRPLSIFIGKANENATASASPRGDQGTSAPLDVRRRNDSKRQMTMPNRQSKKAFLNPDKE